MADGIDTYLEKVKALTGKTWQDFKALIDKQGLTKHGEIVAWLKSEHGLGHGHANAVVHRIFQAEAPAVSDADALAQHFTGAKAQWRAPFDALLTTLKGFGPDVGLSTGKTYISLVRSGKKFGIVQISGKRLDIGIKLAGAPFDETYADASAWNPMVTHRVQIDDPQKIDKNIITWLRKAYEKAK